MKNLIIVLLIAAGIYYYMGQSSKCETEEDLKNKAAEMLEKFQALATSGDLTKIMSLSKRVQDIKIMQTKMDIPSACKAMDELMKEL